MMNEDEETQRYRLRDSWIESLLASAVTPEDHSDRIALAIGRIDEAGATFAPKLVPTPRRSLRWGAIALAASILLALFFGLDGGGTSATALAAVQRSLTVATEQLTRKYLLQIQYRTPAGGKSEIENELYVQGHDRFALRHPGILPNNSFWLGKNENQEWIVPPIGPVRIGTDMLLSRWLASHQELDTPYLHVTTLLTRMSEGYHLEMKSNEEVILPDGTRVECELIHAELESADDVSLPATIELCVSRESGKAIRIVAQWNLVEGQAGSESITLTFQSDEPSLSDKWFSPETHYEGNRVIMRVDSLGQPIFERP